MKRHLGTEFRTSVRKTNHRLLIPVTSPHTESTVESLAKSAKRGNVAAGCELLRRAVFQLSQPEDLRDPDLSLWVADFLAAALQQPSQTVSQLMAPRKKDLRGTRPTTPQTQPLSQEVFFRVRKALATGMPRKKVFSDVAEELNALGYRNPKNERLRANSIERAYYAARRKAINSKQQRSP